MTASESEAVEAEALREWHHLTPWAGRMGQLPEADPHWTDCILAAACRLRGLLSALPPDAPDQEIDR